MNVSESRALCHVNFPVLFFMCSNGHFSKRSLDFYCKTVINIFECGFFQVLLNLELKNEMVLLRKCSSVCLQVLHPCKERPSKKSGSSVHTISQVQFVWNEKRVVFFNLEECNSCLTTFQIFNITIFEMAELWEKKWFFSPFFDLKKCIKHLL